MIFWGSSLVVIGTLILLSNLGIFDMHLREYIVPAAFIIMGIRLLVSRKKNDDCC